MYVCLSVCLSVYVYVCTIILAKSVDGFLWNMHDDRFWPNLKHGLKILANAYYDNEKKPKMVILPENPLELQI